MYNNVFALIPQGDLTTRQSGNTRAFIPGNAHGSDINIIGDTKKDMEGGTLAYSPESVASQKAYWDIINTLDNVRDHIKDVVRRDRQFLRVCIKAPGLKRVDDSSALSVTDKVIRNTLPVALKTGYLETTDPQWFAWTYNPDKNIFTPTLTSSTDKPYIPDGVYVIKDNDLRANSCITATRLLSWMKLIEDTFMKEVSAAMTQLGESCPYAEGWTMSFVSDDSNNLFDRVYKHQSREYLPPKANSRLTIVGTENELQLLIDFLDARNLPTDFKVRLIKDDLLEKNKGEEELGAIFAGEVAQDELPYGLFMYPAWVTMTGSVYTARRSWSMLKHWIRLPLSSAVDKSDAYYKVLRSVACYGAMPSILGGYLIATSAGFFHVDDLKNPQVVSYRTLEELNTMEGFPVCTPVTQVGFSQSWYGDTKFRRYLCGARTYYFKKHPLEQYGNAEKFIDLKKHTNLVDYTFPCMKMRNMPTPRDAFGGTCLMKGGNWREDLFIGDARIITITSYLQDIMYTMFHHEQAVFFKEEKFVNSYTDDFNSYMNGLFKEDVVCDAFVIKLYGQYFREAGFKIDDYERLAVGSLYDDWYFAIPRSF